MARPSKLTKELRDRICRLIRAGNYPAVAAQAEGIAQSTFYRWMEQGRSEAKGPHRDFYEAVKESEAEAEVYNVAVLSTAAKRDWRAAMALLERRHPERWRRHERRELVLEDERPVVDLTLLSDRELKTLEEINARTAKPQ